MKCIHCHGEMVRNVAPFHVDRKGYHLLLDAVPAWVCSQCGEAYFEESEVQSVDELKSSQMEQAGQDAQPWKDAIVEDVRAARERLLAGCGYDLEELVKRLRREQQAEGRKAIARPARL